MDVNTLKRRLAEVEGRAITECADVLRAFSDAVGIMRSLIEEDVVPSLRAVAKLQDHVARLNGGSVPRLANALLCLAEAELLRAEILRLEADNGDH